MSDRRAQRRKMIGPYELHSKIGSGSFATVYRATHWETGDVVAVKKVKKEGVDIHHLKGEVEVMEQLDHPHITRLLEYKESKRHVYLVMEYCGGGDFHQLLRKRAPLPEDEARVLLRQIVAAMMYISESGIVHRDLKPQNMLLTDSDPPQVKIADFGFARSLGQASLASTRLGTPLYMAPEILLNEPYDARVDVWSLGAIFYQMVAGRPPFNATNYGELHAAVTTRQVTFPDTPALSDSARSLIRAMLTLRWRQRVNVYQVAAHPFLREAPMPTRAAADPAHAPREGEAQGTGGGGEEAGPAQGAPAAEEGDATRPRQGPSPAAAGEGEGSDGFVVVNSYPAAGEGAETGGILPAAQPAARAGFSADHIPRHAPGTLARDPCALVTPRTVRFDADVRRAANRMRSACNLLPVPFGGDAEEDGPVAGRQPRLLALPPAEQLRRAGVPAASTEHFRAKALLALSTLLARRGAAVMLLGEQWEDVQRAESPGEALALQLLTSALLARALDCLVVASSLCNRAQASAAATQGTATPAVPRDLARLAAECAPTSPAVTWLTRHIARSMERAARLDRRASQAATVPPAAELVLETAMRTARHGAVSEMTHDPATAHKHFSTALTLLEVVAMTEGVTARQMRQLQRVADATAARLSAVRARAPAQESSRHGSGGVAAPAAEPVVEGGRVATA